MFGVLIRGYLKNIFGFLGFKVASAFLMFLFFLQRRCEARLGRISTPVLQDGTKSAAMRVCTR